MCAQPLLKTLVPFAALRTARARMATFLTAVLVGTALLVATPAAAATTVHVQSITVQLWGSPKPGDGEFTVVIQDQNGLPVADANVSANIYVQNTTRWTSGYTDSTGSITLATGGALKGNSFTIAISDVSATGDVYDPSANVVTKLVVRL